MKMSIEYIMDWMEREGVSDVLLEYEDWRFVHYCLH